MNSLRPLIGALALTLLLAARTAPDLAESLVLSAADGLADSVTDGSGPLALFSDAPACQR